jgi:hypothetical protein
MKLPQAKSYFPAPLSPCCKAPIDQGSKCTQCFQPVPAAFFFYSNAPMDDDVVRLIEKRIRSAPSMPVGAELVMFVREGLTVADLAI